jgi:hypothetical protein
LRRRDAVRLSFTLRASARVQLVVFDGTGRRVAVLVDGARSAGRHEAIWTGTGAIRRRDTESGLPVGAGLYFARIETAGGGLTRRFALLR